MSEKPTDRCPTCEGLGYTVEPSCCGRGTVHGCCGDPDPMQVQCQPCNGTGEVEILIDLPKFPPALPDDELRLLASLPEWDTQQELTHEEWPIARRLERKGLIKISRTQEMLFAGKLATASLRQAT